MNNIVEGIVVAMESDKFMILPFGDVYPVCFTSKEYPQVKLGHQVQMRISDVRDVRGRRISQCVSKGAKENIQPFDKHVRIKTTATTMEWFTSPITKSRCLWLYSDEYGQIFDFHQRFPETTTLQIETQVVIRPLKNPDMEGALLFQVEFNQSSDVNSKKIQSKALFKIQGLNLLLPKEICTVQPETTKIEVLSRGQGSIRRSSRFTADKVDIEGREWVYGIVIMQHGQHFSILPFKEIYPVYIDRRKFPHIRIGIAVEMTFNERDLNVVDVCRKLQLHALQLLPITYEMDNGRRFVRIETDAETIGYVQDPTRCLQLSSNNYGKSISDRTCLFPPSTPLKLKTKILIRPEYVNMYDDEIRYVVDHNFSTDPRAMMSVAEQNKRNLKCYNDLRNLYNTMNQQQFNKMSVQTPLAITTQTKKPQAQSTSQLTKNINAQSSKEEEIMLEKIVAKLWKMEGFRNAVCGYEEDFSIRMAQLITKSTFY